MKLREGRLEKTPYKHRTHLGLYLGIFLFEKKLTIKQACKLSGVSVAILKGTLGGTYNIGIQSYFRIADLL